ncbi:MULTISPECIES: hypothetical protein [Enterococcus]|uniref:hypothetical protein n=1 Tax=Enterococcus TaxID=1350 RepID=UPI00065E4DB7|nr:MULTISPECIES: hypothetical protein [Enterococcus]KAF1303555.1 hypothetical protein BAU16_04225 [Enterococcus sp. JM9B]
MDKLTLIQQFITFPSDYQLTEQTNEKRNNRKVDIFRYQKNGEFMLNGPRIIAIFQKDTLVSLKNFSSLPTGTLFDFPRAKTFGEELFEKINPTYAKHLSFLRIEKQQRSYLSEGTAVTFPVEWVKFAHSNGSYNWVTLGGDGTLIEMEIDSRWDYFRGRRKTEMWDNDDWVLAHEGNGPQLPAPQALA